ncbi:MAG: helical backbone metal receptor [Bacteroidia bacterium]|nr:helical backbone metal receptor [Bacteroidia bacterium]MDW8301062.1 helical backbone metal receptor [Bacteroidia bacterium]
MLHKLKFYCIAVSLFLMSEACQTTKNKKEYKSFNIVDDVKQNHFFSHHPRRVVCLVPSVTELLYAIDADSQIVAVTEHCNYPERAKNHPKKLVVYPNVSTEQVLALKPDVILASTEIISIKLIEQFKPHQIPVFFVNYQTLNDIPRTVRVLGKLLGKEIKSNQIADSVEKVIQEYAQYSPLHRPKMWVAIGTQPLYTAGKNSFINDMVYISGGQNIAESITYMAYPVLTREFILSQRPEYLVVSHQQKSTVQQTLLRLYPEMKSLPCLQDTSKIIGIEEDLLVRPTLRSLEAVKKLRSVILKKSLRQNN